MIRLAISVEGPTEEQFVNRVLAEHLRLQGVEPTPVLLGRARGRYGGGNVSIDRLVPELIHLLRSFDCVTSLVDFYGFRQKGEMNVEELEEQLVQRIGKAIGQVWNPETVIPYVQQHEFEGLLFSDVDAFKNAINAPQEVVYELRSIREEFITPEDINDNRNTAPSKRIQQAIITYDKFVHGPLIALATGLEVIRAECPRFANWVSKLETLGK